MDTRRKRSLDLSLIAVVAIAFTSLIFASALSAQAKSAGEGIDSTSDDIGDFADVISPTDSFKYFLHAVTMSDEDYAKVLLERLPNLPADHKFTASEIYDERQKAIEISFDFESAIREKFEDGGENPIDPKKKKQYRHFWMQQFLSPETQLKFDQRNIKFPELTPVRPDWTAETTHIFLDIKNLVTGDWERHQIYMKLYAKAFIWRWYKSEIVPMETGSEIAVDSSDDEKADKEKIAELDEEIKERTAQLEKMRNDLDELEAEIRRAKKHLDKTRDVRAELVRRSAPYATPDSALRTAYKAFREGDWDTFVKSHSARVRANAGDVAQKHFEDASAKGQLKGHPRIKKKVVDEDDPTIVTITAEVFVSTKEKFDLEDEDPAKGPIKDIDALKRTPEIETRVWKFRIIKEAGNWVIDEEIG